MTKFKAQQVTLNDITYTCKEGPFGSKFTVENARIVQYDGVDELMLRATCTEDSIEPGRIYSCIYAIKGKQKGKLLECCTLN
jgi:hypothetical protein